MEPRFKITLSDRTLGNGLSTFHLQQIRSILLDRGMVLLPSDTCYALAAIPGDKEVYKLINKILNRGKLPMSLAFPNFERVQYYVKVNVIVANLIEVFTPGPITVVCKPLSENVREKKVKDVINSTDGTIGVRISDSHIEREVAGCSFFPITTAAVRDENGNVVQDFNKAIEIVTNGTQKNKFTNWAVIEGNNFLSQHSTVVRVDYSSNEVIILRKGLITEQQIKKGIENRFPQWAREEWP
ncbi:MAG: hypothetical protein A2068_09680 [Ignavibacteria bacterium GWB2_35_6b]|nr:MAG: hypothetical protein A2068_09680 [Ignavibacteria bacterium GWB2_35_6b]